MTTPALIIPDERTWSILGLDPLDLGLRPVFEVGAAEAILVPDPVPPGLVEPLRRMLEELQPDVRRVVRATDRWDGVPFDEVVHAGHADAGPAPGDNEGHGEHEMGGGGGHDMGGHDMGGHDMGGHDMGGHDMGGHDMGGHGDMMAITGEPSADGLVMEPINFEFGPLGTPLPGGLVAEVELDGDVVASCSLRPMLNLHPKHGDADPFTRAAARAGGRGPWTDIAAIEVERALSHVTWLRSITRLLAWRELASRLDALLAGIRRAEDAADPSAFRELASRTRTLAGSVVRNRALRLRTAGRGVVSAETARQSGLAGPDARATGLRVDARSDDPLYTQLGFAPCTREEGDIRARLLVRIDEVAQSLELAAVARQLAGNGTAPAAGDGTKPGPDDGLEPAGAPVAVEPPRGSASASRAALETAAQAAIGDEWATALLVLASFDLSPWAVA